MNVRTKEIEDYLRIFSISAKKIGLKYSFQREWVMRVLLATKSHLTSREISIILKKEFGFSVGETTVNRILKSLLDLDIVGSLQTTGEAKKFEIKPNKHHDHLICNVCEEIFEFVNPEIESLQEEIAQKMGFSITSHVLTLYGICAKCKAK